MPATTVIAAARPTRLTTVIPIAALVGDRFAVLFRSGVGRIGHRQGYGGSVDHGTVRTLGELPDPLAQLGHRPAGPPVLTADLGGGDLGAPGRSAASTAAWVSSSQPFGVGQVRPYVGRTAQRGQCRGQDGRDRRRVPDGRRVEAIGREHPVGSQANCGPSRSPSETVRAPAATAATVWAAAISRLQRRTTQRSGGRIGRMVPRSGHVDDDVAAGVTQPSYRVGQVPDGDRRPYAVRDVVDSDEDDRELRLGDKRTGHLVIE